MNYDDANDEQLVRLYKRGELSAFDELVRRYQDRVFRMSAVWLFDDQLAADATQEVFLRGYKGLRAFRFSATVFTWLYRTCRNVCHELNRKHTVSTQEQDIHDERAGPEETTSAMQSAVAVRELIKQLPQRQQEVVLLRVFEDLSVRETAKAMKCREGTVKALLHKAVSRLRLNTADLDIREL